MDGVAVFAVVEQGDAVVALGEVHPLLPAVLEARLVPAGVLVHLALQAAELHVEGGLVAVHGHGELHLQQVLVQRPVNGRLEVDAAAIGIEAHVLPDGDARDLVLQVQRGAHGARFRPLELREVVHIPGLLGVILVDVPVVVVDGLVLEHAQQVGAAAGLHDLAAVLAVVDGAEVPVFVQSDTVEGRCERAALQREGALRRRAVRGQQGLVALRRQAADIGHGALRRALHGEHAALAVAEGGAARVGQADDVVALEAERVEHGHGPALAGQAAQPLAEQRVGLFAQGLVLRLRHLVHLVYRAAGQYVVELVGEHGLPHAVQLLPGIGQLVLRHHGGQLQVHQQQLVLAVGALVAGHGGERAAVVLEIELALPGVEPGVVLHARFQFAEILAGELLAHLRYALDAALHALGHFQHLAGGAAAAVAVAKGHQDVVVDLLVLIALPAAHDGVRVQAAVVGGEKVLLHVLPHVNGGDEVREHLAAVDAAPDEGVVGDLVDLVPGQLGGHEIVDAAALHDLRQGAGIAEHVRQPEDAAVYAELILEKALAVHELPDEGLAGGEVGVGLHPHAAFGLPAALGHALLHARVHLGVALAQEVVEHALAGHEAVVRVLVHQLEDGGEAARHLLAHLGNGPPPGHVDVRVADAGGDHVVPAAHALIEPLFQQSARGGHAGVVLRRIGPAQVEPVHRVVEHGLYVETVLVVLVHAGEGPERHLQVVIQPVHLLVEPVELHDQVELAVQRAGVGLHVDAEGLAARGALCEAHFAVVHVQALLHFPVHEEEELRVFAVVVFVYLRADVHPHAPAGELLRHREVGAEPVVLVRAVPVHVGAVEMLPGVGGVGLRLLGAEVKPLLIAPAAHGGAVADALAAQLVAYHLDALIDEVHMALLKGCFL